MSHGRVFILDASLDDLLVNDVEYLDYEDLHHIIKCDYADVSDDFKDDLKWLQDVYPVTIKKEIDNDDNEQIYGVLWENEADREKILKIAMKYSDEHKKQLIEKISVSDSADYMRYLAGVNSDFYSYLNHEYEVLNLFELIMLNRDKDELYVIGSLDYHY